MARVRERLALRKADKADGLQFFKVSLYVSERARDIGQHVGDGIAVSDAIRMAHLKEARVLPTSELDDIYPLLCQQAKTAASVAAKASQNSWKQWLSRGLTGGAGPAHALLKKGSSPTPTVRFNTDGVAAVLPQEKFAPRRDRWGPTWSAYPKTRDEAVRLMKVLLGAAKQARKFPLIVGAQVTSAIRILSKTKGVGTDFWHPATWKRLPEEARAELALLLNLAELRASC